MRVRSLALHTDLALHRWRGRVADHGDHLVITHPDNPGFRWGNVLVFDRPPEPGDLARWCERFDDAIGVPPAFDHRAFAWDGPGGDEGDIEPFLAAGFEREVNTVMAAPRLEPPERPNRDVRIEAIIDDAGWRRVLAGQLAAFERERPDEAFDAFLTALMAAYRRAVEAGHGVWWGAYDGEALVANLGIFRIGSLARYQAVVTATTARRRGIASTLVHHAAEQARQAWGSSLVLLEAEPTGSAIGLYERLGFSPIERRVGVVQFPRGEGAPTTT